MSTDNEKTLQINLFTGIDRYNSGGTSRGPGEFYTLQNIEVVSDGVIQTIGGVTEQSTNIPGCSSIVHTAFIENALGGELSINYYKPTFNTVPMDSSAASAALASGAVSMRFGIVYVGAGGARKSTFFNASANSNGLWTTPTGISSAVHQVLFYTGHASASGSSSAYSFQFQRAMSRKSDGTFASAINIGTLATNLNQTTSALASGDTIAGQATVAIFQASTGGTLTPNKTYYFGLTPKISATAYSDGLQLPEVSLRDAASTFYTYQLPAGYNAINTVFCGMPVTLYGNTIDYIPFIGVTPEDLAVAQNASGISYLSNTTGNADVINNGVMGFFASDVSSANNTINITDSFRAAFKTGTPVVYTNVGGSDPGGLTSGVTYYITAPTGATVSLAATSGGSPIDITSSGSGSMFLTVNYKYYLFTTDPINNSLTLNMQSQAYRNGGASPSGVSGGAEQSAAAARQAGRFNAGFWNEDGFTSIDTASASIQVLGMRAVSALPYAASASWEIMPNHFNYAFALNSKSTTYNDPQPVKLAYYQPGAFASASSTPEIYTREYFNRQYCTNGVNQLCYTNGYAFQPVMRDYQTALVPLTQYIEIFSQRTILGGGPTNFANTEGVFFYSQTANPFSYTSVASAVSPAWNFLNVRAGDDAFIKGFGTYSQDLATDGPTAFLVIGKNRSIFTWNGDVSQGTKQIDRRFGFAGPRCFTLIDQGPIFVASDGNVYLIKSSEEIIQIGDQVVPILSALSTAQLYNVNAVFSNEVARIGYTASSSLDAEVWLRYVKSVQSPDRYPAWTGPHVMKSYTGQSVGRLFSGIIDARVSFLNDKIYLRDSTTSQLNDGSSAVRQITFNRMGLGADHFWKVPTRVYMGVTVAQNETFNYSFTAQDGSSGTMSFSATAASSNGLSQIVQAHAPSRFLGRIMSFSASNQSASAWSLYDMSILFQGKSRRKLR